MREEQLTTIYNSIANKVDEIIPVEWEKVVMYAEDLGDVSNAAFYFYTQDGKYHYSNNIPEEFNVNEEIIEKLLEDLWELNSNLRQEFVNNQEEPWNYIIFSLNKDWNFKIKFGYDLNQDIGDFEREVRWAYDELGIVPQGEFAKQILDEYLKEKNS